MAIKWWDPWPAGGRLCCDGHGWPLTEAFLILGAGAGPSTAGLAALIQFLVTFLQVVVVKPGASAMQSLAKVWPRQAASRTTEAARGSSVCP